MSRKPRLVAHRLIEANTKCPSLEPFVKPKQTDADRLYALIQKECEDGYRFTDDEYGLPWIKKSDMVMGEDNVYCIRFRFPPLVHLILGIEVVADNVCKKLKTGKHLYLAERKEYGIPFMEGAWVLSISQQ